MHRLFAKDYESVDIAIEVYPHEGAWVVVVIRDSGFDVPRNARLYVALAFARFEEEADALKAATIAHKRLISLDVAINITACIAVCGRTKSAQESSIAPWQ